MPFTGYTRDEQGAYIFQKDDGSTLRTVASPASFYEAKRLDMAGMGPAVDPEMVNAIPARRGAMDADALAAAPTKAPSVVLDIGPPPAAGPGVKVGLGNQIDLTPAAPPAGGGGLPVLTPQQIAKGFSGKSKAEPLPMTPQSGGGDLRVLLAQDAAAKAATPAGPPQLVPTPEQQPKGAAGGKAGPPTGNAQDYQAFIRSEIAAEAGKRASGGSLVKGGKTQTHEAWQGEAGPNAETLEQQHANDAETARMQKLQLDANAERDAEISKIQQDQAEHEERYAGTQAEIAKQRQIALSDLNEQSLTLQKKIASAEIDPKKFWKDRSTAHEFAAAFAIAMGAVGNAIAGNMGPNAPLEIIQKAMDRDLDVQMKNIDKQRGDLNDLQRIYAQTKEKFGDEAMAAEAAKVAGLTAYKAQLQREAARADAVQATDPVFRQEHLRDMAEMEGAMREAMGGDTPLAQQAAEAKMRKLASQTRSYSVKSKLLELGLERDRLDRQAAYEARANGVISRQFGFTQDRYVGGSAGPDRKRMHGLYKDLNDAEGEQRKLSVSEREAAAKGQVQAKGLFVDGEFIPANPNAQGEVLKDAQARITYSDSLLGDIAAVRKRMTEPGAYAPGDPQAKIDAGALAKSFSRAASNEAASESDKNDMAAAVTPGPRQDAALRRLESKARSFKSDALKSVGAAK